MFYIISKVGVCVVLRAMSVLIEATEKNDSYSTCLNDHLQVFVYSGDLLVRTHG